MCCEGGERNAGKLVHLQSFFCYHATLFISRHAFSCKFQSVNLLSIVNQSSQMSQSFSVLLLGHARLGLGPNLGGAAAVVGLAQHPHRVDEELGRVELRRDAHLRGGVCLGGGRGGGEREGERKEGKRERGRKGPKRVSHKPCKTKQASGSDAQSHGYVWCQLCHPSPIEATATSAFSAGEMSE